MSQLLLRALLFLALLPVAARASPLPDLPKVICQFDEAAAGPLPASVLMAAETGRGRRSAADMVIQSRLNIRLDFPVEGAGTMYQGMLHGEPAVFTRAGDHLDAAVLRDGEIELTSFGSSSAVAGTGGAAGFPADVARPRMSRSVPEDHFEDPAAYNLHFYVLKHDDLLLYPFRKLHARHAAWWLADLSMNVLPTEPMRISYVERVPWLTDMAYGQAGSLQALEHVLTLLDEEYEFGMASTHKRKFLLVTAHPPVAGATGLAYLGGNEGMASTAGRMSIVAHEMGHMLGATHAHADTGSLLRCETNMVPRSNRRRECLHYSPANQREIRSYMRYGPATQRPRPMEE